jgi:hypothetical protein
MGKDLTGVRSSHRQLVPDGVGLDQHEPTFLRAIAIKAKTDKRHRFQEGVRLMVTSCAYASTTEEPGGGNPHAGVCAGGTG